MYYGCSLLRKIHQIELADTYIFRTTFCKDFNNVNFINIGSCPSMSNLCPAGLLNFAEQASGEAELGRRGDLSDQKT